MTGYSLFVHAEGVNDPGTAGPLVRFAGLLVTPTAHPLIYRPVWTQSVGTCAAHLTAVSPPLAFAPYLMLPTSSPLVIHIRGTGNPGMFEITAYRWISSWGCHACLAIIGHGDNAKTYLIRSFLSGIFTRTNVVMRNVTAAEPAVNNLNPQN
jgi:hypothetical protein